MTIEVGVDMVVGDRVVVDMEVVEDMEVEVDEEDLVEAVEVGLVDVVVEVVAAIVLGGDAAH